jgi:hypothetical protein
MQNILARVFHSRQTEKEGSMNESDSKNGGRKWLSHKLCQLE